MQLKKLSLFTITALAVTTLQAEDYVSVQVMQYNESNDRAEITAPHLEINKDFGTDYTLNVGFVADALSGASPTYHDSSSGASAYSRGTTTQQNVVYGPVDYEENRAAVNVSLTKRFDNRDELTTGLAYSSESDFYSFEGSAEYLHWLGESKNQAISFGAAYQANEILIKECIENSDCDTSSSASKKMTADVLNTQLGFTQVIDKDSVAKVAIFMSIEDGYLTNPYMNIVRNYNTQPYITAEKRPDERTSYGLTLKYIRSLNDQLTLHTKYRYYSDDWKINSHTLNLDSYYELTSDWTLGAGLRYYTQSEADFYNGNKAFFTDQKYASSDERLSDFDAITYKFNADYRLSKKINLNFGANYYDQGDYFDATYFTVGAKYRF
ncbi:MAG: DUF3570 domain-containing protein [Epsilonproteobacteria bacterium]|nr:DUF3570 domain-containing protein [Campylobacterota bacterium]